MRRFLALALASAFAITAAAQSLPSAPISTNTNSRISQTIFAGNFSTPLLVATTVYAGFKTDRPMVITRVTGRNTTAAGTGTGAWRITDGTNTCDCNFACATDGAINTTFSDACAGSGGTGCSYATGALLTLVWQTACTTTQPTIQDANVVGL